MKVFELPHSTVAQNSPNIKDSFLNGLLPKELAEFNAPVWRIHTFMYVKGNRLGGRLTKQRTSCLWRAQE